MKKFNSNFEKSTALRGDDLPNEFVNTVVMAGTLATIIMSFLGFSALKDENYFEAGISGGVIAYIIGALYLILKRNRG